MRETGNQADAFVISNVLVITTASDIFICNTFVTGDLVQIPIIRIS